MWLGPALVHEEHLRISGGNRRTPNLPRSPGMAPCPSLSGSSPDCAGSPRPSTGRRGPRSQSAPLLAGACSQQGWPLVGAPLSRSSWSPAIPVSCPELHGAGMQLGVASTLCLTTQKYRPLSWPCLPGLGPSSLFLSHSSCSPSSLRHFPYITKHAEHFAMTSVINI